MHWHDVRPGCILGQSIGPHTLIERIGCGRTGAVYLAEHETDRSQVAIRVFHATFSAKPENIQRCMLEAQAIQGVDHPGIARVLGFGRLVEIGPYVVMEYLKGETLADRIQREGRLSPGAVLRIIRRIAWALSAAHDQGILHRNLKPSNIFLVAPHGDYPDREWVKLADFGLTSAALIGGTPPYAAPEANYGEQALDERSDVYSLAILAYELLSGRPPYFGDSLEEIWERQRSSLPAPLIQAGLHLPDRVEAAICKALSPDPENRPDSVADFAQLLPARMPPPLRRITGPFHHSEKEEEPPQAARPSVEILELSNIDATPIFAEIVAEAPAENVQLPASLANVVEVEQEKKEQPALPTKSAQPETPPTPTKRIAQRKTRTRRPAADVKKAKRTPPKQTRKAPRSDADFFAFALPMVAICGVIIYLAVGTTDDMQATKSAEAVSQTEAPPSLVEEYGRSLPPPLRGTRVERAPAKPEKDQPTLGSINGPPRKGGTQTKRAMPTKRRVRNKVAQAETQNVSAHNNAEESPVVAPTPTKDLAGVGKSVGRLTDAAQRDEPELILSKGLRRVKKRNFSARLEAERIEHRRKKKGASPKAVVTNVNSSKSKIPTKIAKAAKQGRHMRVYYMSVTHLRKDPMNHDLLSLRGVAACHLQKPEAASEILHRLPPRKRRRMLAACRKAETPLN
jgi:eukaryotic-like serine/threonine-protein kinase